jgi:hypothetical protein
MLRKTLAAIAGLIVWVLVVSAADRLLRAGWPAYSAALPDFAFTLPMQLARLAEGALASLAAGAAIARLGRPPGWAPLAAGAVLVAGFVPVHYQLWARFPVWYHLVFLGTLLPLVLAGARLARRPAGPAGAGPGR